MNPLGDGACEEGTAEAGRELDPTASEGEARHDDQPARDERGISHGSPLPAAERDRLKEEARRGGSRDRGGQTQIDPAQRDEGN